MSKGKDGGDGAGVTERLHRAEEAESATPEHTATGGQEKMDTNVPSEVPVSGEYESVTLDGIKR